MSFNANIDPREWIIKFCQMEKCTVMMMLSIYVIVKSLSKTVIPDPYHLFISAMGTNITMHLYVRDLIAPKCIHVRPLL